MINQNNSGLNKLRTAERRHDDDVDSKIYLDGLDLLNLGLPIFWLLQSTSKEKWTFLILSVRKK